LKISDLISIARPVLPKQPNALFRRSFVVANRTEPFGAFPPLSFSFVHRLASSRESASESNARGISLARADAEPAGVHCLRIYA